MQNFIKKKSTVFVFQNNSKYSTMAGEEIYVCCRMRPENAREKVCFGLLHQKRWNYMHANNSHSSHGTDNVLGLQKANAKLCVQLDTSSNTVCMKMSKSQRVFAFDKVGISSGLDVILISTYRHVFIYGIVCFIKCMPCCRCVRIVVVVWWH